MKVNVTVKHRKAVASAKKITKQKTVAFFGEETNNGIGISESPQCSPAGETHEQERRKYILERYKKKPFQLQDDLLILLKLKGILDRDVIARSQAALIDFFKVMQVAALTNPLTDDAIVCLNDGINVANRLYYSMSDLESLANTLEGGNGTGTYVLSSSATKNKVEAKQALSFRGNTDPYIAEISDACRRKKFSSGDLSGILQTCKRIKEAYSVANWASDADWPFFCHTLLDVIKKEGAEETYTFVRKHLKEEMSKSLRDA